MNLKAVLEGILFVVGDEGITKEQLMEVMNINNNKLLGIVDELKDEYNNINRGITIELLGDRYKLLTKKEHHEYYERLVLNEQSTELSQAALETLAIIVYNEPITRMQVDEIRGVSSSHILRKLTLRDMIKEVGRSDLPGRPILYSTTSKFYDYFGLKSKEDLPKIDITKEQSFDEINLFESKYKED